MKDFRSLVRHYWATCDSEERARLLHQVDHASASFADWAWAYEQRGGELRALALEKMAATAKTIFDWANLCRLAPDDSQIQQAVLAELEAWSTKDPGWQALSERPDLGPLLCRIVEGKLAAAEPRRLADADY